MAPAPGEWRKERDPSVSCLVPSAITTASTESYLLGSCASSDNYSPLSPSKPEPPSVRQQMVLLQPTLSRARGGQVSKCIFKTQGSTEARSPGSDTRVSFKTGILVGRGQGCTCEGANMLSQQSYLFTAL